MSYTTEVGKKRSKAPFIMVGAGVIIENGKGEILLQYRKDTQDWGLPGGAMEPGESLEETAAREVAEETGLLLGKIVFYRMFSGREYAFTYPNGDQVYSVTAIYIARQYGGQLRADGAEAAALRFFPLYGLPEPFQAACKKFVDSYAADHFWTGVE